jgi:hypothetical protein
MPSAPRAGAGRGAAGHGIGSRLLELVARSARQDGFRRSDFTPVGEQVQVINGSRTPVVILTRDR